MFKKKSNYFIIFYIGVGSNGQFVGHAAFELISKFPNNKELVEYLKERAIANTVTITNILRVTKAEYTEWCRK